MGFRYTHIKRTRKNIPEENADSAVRSAEAIPEHELCTLRARGKEWKKPTTTTEHNKRDVNPRLFPHSVSTILQCVGEKPKNFRCFFYGPVRILYLGRSINYLLHPLRRN